MGKRNLRPIVGHDGAVWALIRIMNTIAWNTVTTQKPMSSYVKESQKTYTQLDCCMFIGI